MKDLDYIKKFSKISISEACRKCNVNRSNLLNGKASKENVKKIREELESQVFTLYIKKSDKNE